VIDHAAALSESPTIRPFAGINAMHEDQYLVPALAIPTQTKAHFQCPPSDVEALENALPNVDRVLVIGWRGGEQQFLDLWSDRTNSNLAGVVVGGDQQAADAVRAKIEESISGRFRPSAAAGFTPFVDSEEGLVHLLESLGEKDF
jgi:hypothetical protein